MAYDPLDQGEDLRECAWPDCTEAGLYPAPRSRDELRDYQHFCLEHVRQFNAQWDYFKDLSEAEIEAQIRNDTIWNRPTWPFGRGGFKPDQKFDDPFGFFAEEEAMEHRPPARTAEEKAMRELGLDPPLDMAAVKKRYKELVKRYHPDATGGDKAAEERFKRITEAYKTLIEHLSSAG